MAVCSLTFFFKMIDSIILLVQERADPLRNVTVILRSIKNDLNPKQCFCFSFFKPFIHNIHKFQQCALCFR